MFCIQVESTSLSKNQYISPFAHFAQENSVIGQPQPIEPPKNLCCPAAVRRKGKSVREGEMKSSGS